MQKDNFHKFSWAGCRGNKAPFQLKSESFRESKETEIAILHWIRNPSTLMSSLQH